MNAKDKIKQAWDENPIQVAIVVTAMVGAVGKLIDAVSAIQGRRAYAQQVKQRGNRNKR